MAVDLQVVFPQEAIILNNVRILNGPPRVVDVNGADFRSVDEVLINKLLSPDVVILSKTRLVAQVPDALADQHIFTVQVLSRRLTITPRSLLRFRVGKKPGKVSGIQRLLQKFLRILFTTPGTDIFNKSLGGGGLVKVGQTFGMDEGSDILSNLIISIDTTARQLIALQARNPSLPLDERLLSAKVTKAGFDKSEGAIDVVVEIVSQAGRAAVANLEF